MSDRCKTYNEETIMLIQFNFKNFKSFRDEVSLDLTATKITEHEDHVASMAPTQAESPMCMMPLNI